MSLGNAMNSKRVQLVWDNHLQNISDLFSILHDNDYLVDVTLFCRDGFIKAHKIVLSACSPYFKQIFQVNPCKHPTIILREVLHRDMTALIEYMYKGIINVPSENLNGIVKLAHDLKIKGFDDIKSTETTHATNDNNHADDGVDNIMNLVPTCILTEPQEINDSENSLYGGSNHKKRYSSDSTSDTFLKVTREEPVNERDLMGGMKDISDSDSNGSDTTHPESIYHKSYYTCNECNQRFPSKREMKNHKRSHLGKPFTCDFCQKGFSRMSHLIRHRRVHTGERPFDCKNCGKSFARQDKLKLHMRSSHENLFFYDSSSVKSFHEEGLDMDYVPIIQRKPVEPPKMTLTIPTVKLQMKIASNQKTHSNETEPMKEIKRGRGRPRKKPLPEPDTRTPKRKRGRPRKEESLRRAQTKILTQTKKKSLKKSISIVPPATSAAPPLETTPMLSSTPAPTVRQISPPPKLILLTPIQPIPVQAHQLDNHPTDLTCKSKEITQDVRSPSVITIENSPPCQDVDDQQMEVQDLSMNSRMQSLEKSEINQRSNVETTNVSNGRDEPIQNVTTEDLQPSRSIVAETL